MDVVAVGWWGAYFGIAAVAFLAFLVPLTNGLPRVAILMAAAPLLNVLYTLPAIGWLPGGETLNLRVQSGMALHNAVALSALMLMLIRMHAWVRRAWTLLIAASLVLAVVVWNVEARTGMLVATSYAILCGLLALSLLFTRSGMRNDRVAWLAIVSASTVVLGLVGTAWLAATRPVSWEGHALTALVVIVHQVSMAIAIWNRFSHLAEVRLVRTFGSGYDPVTRMRSLENAGELINSVFAGRGAQSVGAVVITVANLYALENLHGRAEHNQALFILASRLRRTVPRGVQMCRLGPDVFLLLMRRAETQQLVHMAQRLRDRLARPIGLGTGNQPSEVHMGAHEWSAEVGIGVLSVPPEQNAAAAVNMARSMSRTALSYPSRIACYSDAQQEFVEVVLQPSPG